jgi:hypothetical protein
MRKNPKLQLVVATAATVVAAVSMLSVLAQSAPQPVLTIAPTGTNTFILTITNGVASTNYEIYRRAILTDPAYPWTLHQVGTNGQTNFIVSIGIETSGHFMAGIGSDWDLDGVPNWIDANDKDSTIGALTITIDSPTNGASLY